MDLKLEQRLLKEFVMNMLMGLDIGTKNTQRICDEHADGLKNGA